jgi:uncharacterized protein YndB with AHSA1/START domain
VVGVIAAVAGIGWTLPVAHTASRQATVRVAPADVYAVISDVERYPAWWSEISGVEMLPAASGRIRFREHMSTGPVIMEVEEADAPSRFVTRIADPDQPFGGTWTFDLAPEGAGTRVTLTENGEVYNPIFRFMARFVFGHTGTIESCLRALERRLRQ